MPSIFNKTQLRFYEFLLNDFCTQTGTDVRTEVIQDYLNDLASKNIVTVAKSKKVKKPALSPEEKQALAEAKAKAKAEKQS